MVNHVSSAVCLSKIIRVFYSYIIPGNQAKRYNACLFVSHPIRVLSHLIRGFIAGPASSIIGPEWRQCIALSGH